MSDIWNTVHQERASLIRDLNDLPELAWQTPSLCKGWTVHDVLAHLVDAAKNTKPAFIWQMVLAGFDFDKMNQKGVERERQASGKETLANFAKVQNRTTSAPAKLATRLVEAVVHGEDIRLPLGIKHEYPTWAVVEALQYQVATSPSIGGSKETVAGLKLITTDADFTHGEGDEVRGTALDLLLAVTGRPVKSGRLTGPGTPQLSKLT